MNRITRLQICYFLNKFLSYVVVIDEDEPVVNQSIVQEVIEASQRSLSQELCKFTISLLAHSFITETCVLGYQNCLDFLAFWSIKPAKYFYSYIGTPHLK